MFRLTHVLCIIWFCRSLTSRVEAICSVETLQVKERYQNQKLSPINDIDDVLAVLEMLWLSLRRVKHQERRRLRRGRY
jgi:hypothetical protein